jgi:hypothetical protein
MQLDDARKLLEKTPRNYKAKQVLLKGLQILGRYDPDLDSSGT